MGIPPAVDFGERRGILIPAQERRAGYFRPDQGVFIGTSEIDNLDVFRVFPRPDGKRITRL